jgi:transcriptional regulator with XRE-family HTH domain
LRIKLKNAREKNGFTQKEFAEKIGVKLATYQKYEQGARTPKLDMMKTILEKLNENSIEIFDNDRGKKRCGEM